MDFTNSCFLIGFIGDGILQTIVKNSKESNKWGLKTYFETHKSLESLFIASSMMYGFGALYQYIDPKLNSFGLITYGAGLDVLFRNFNLMPTLTDYYKYNSSFVTMFWGFAPFLMSKALTNNGI